MPSRYCLSELDDSEPTFFDVDPAEYDDSPPERRLASFPTAGGVVRQDWGLYDADRKLPPLVTIMTGATRASFLSKYSQEGKEWKLTDFYGASWRVVFADFNCPQVASYDQYRATLKFEIQAKLAEGGQTAALTPATPEALLAAGSADLLAPAAAIEFV